SGSAASGASSGGGSAAINQTQGTSRTTVRGRSAGARIAVRSGSRTAVGVRHAGASDDVIIRRKKARRYVYQEPSTTVVRKKRFVFNEPSTTIVRKKRFVRFHEPSNVVIHKRRAGVAVGGASTRTTVRRGTSATVGRSRTTRESVGAGGRGGQGSTGQGSSGQGNAGAGSSTSGYGQTCRAPSSGGGSSGSSGGSESPSGRQ